MTLAIRPTTAFGVQHHEESQNEIVSVSETGSWILSLPPTLIEHQPELERLLFKVFNNLPKSEHNVQLARQMSLNWCVSKCKQNGLRFEDCLTFHPC